MDKESKKLFNSKAWAISSPSNRAELNDPSITPQIVRASGWGSSFSQSGGDLPDRRHFNQILCETTSAAKEIVMGVSLWDRDVNYPANAITNSNGVLYRAKVNTGPDTNNETNPATKNQIIWELLKGSSKVPDAPESFTGLTPEQNTIVVQWKAGKDNGEKITRWQLRYKERGGGSWGAAETLQYPYKRLTGLDAGTAYVVEARAYNREGYGEWGTSEAVTTGFTATGTVPGGGNVIGLIAESGNAKATLKWTAPNDGGYPIIRYDLQWSEDNNSFNESNQHTLGNTLEYILEGLTNGQKYYFRVRAYNQEGHGEWSNIANATPVAPPITYYAPTLKTPISSEINENSFRGESPPAINSSEGKTYDIVSYSWRIRKAGEVTWNNVSGGSEGSVKFTSLDDNTEYEFNYSATLSNGSNINPENPGRVRTLSATTPVVTYVQPTPNRPIVDYESDGQGASVTAKYNVDGQFSTYQIKKFIWQYRKSGHASWTVYTGSTQSQVIIPNPNINTSENSYDFRFIMNTEGGDCAASPVATLERKQDTPGEVTNLKFRTDAYPQTRYSYDQVWAYVKASWNLPASSGDSILQTQYKCTFGPRRIGYATFDGFIDKVVIDFYTPGNIGFQQTVFQVRVRNSAGWSPWSTVSN